MLLSLIKSEHQGVNDHVDRRSNHQIPALPSDKIAGAFQEFV